MSYHIQICNSCGTANRIPDDKQGASGRCGNCHATLPALYFQPQQLGERNFDDFIRNHGGPVLAEFWAPW
jgi:thioredoxin 2